ncbi:acyl-CoA dehydrogenase family protein [Gordonia sp. (in: high G+C Gram-positive bacteria)]|uniref:acyl-CoA dehydrogenase family protein n=1 Tax=Gordonia sp. (in: high G+C Gram-positive bacteria) TaxID=84139 RepID=UPI00333FAFF8
MTVDPDLIALMNDILRTEVDDPWPRLVDLGLARLTAPEAVGGSGAGWPEASALITAAATAGVAIPFVEHDLLAGWLLRRAHLPSSDARRTACIINDDGVATGVGWAAESERIVALRAVDHGWAVADLPRSEVDVTAGWNRAGEPRDRVHVHAGASAWNRVPDDTGEMFRLRGALARAAATVGALDTILQLSLDHTSARTQFGRPLSRFQAVQHTVADMAAETALARSATEAALTEAVRNDWAGSTAFRIAVARSCVGHAASVVVRGGHQVHGAMGTTAEHRLHRFSRPALAWRNEFGSVASWDRAVADAAVAAGSSGLWDLITS